jgi:hypothetical protein
MTDAVPTRDKILEKVKTIYPDAKSGKIENCSKYKGCKSFNLEFDRFEAEE